MTIGRFIMFISRKIIDFVKKVLRFLYKITVIPLKMAVLFTLKQLKRLIRFVLEIIRMTKSRLYYANEKRKINKDALKGFNLYGNSRKNNGNIDGKTAKSIVEIIKKDSEKNQKTLEKSKEKI